MSYLMVGTAGHIDHGKTSLIKAITNIDADRLKEEKKRGITIDLGFAYYETNNGKKISIVDVPGHEKFIKNMIAGATGIDVVLLVISAEEGIMPQTKEHLDIISILGCKKIILTLTKIDLVDSEWLSFLKEDIKDYLSDTIAQDCEIFEVSSHTGKGIKELKNRLEKLVEEINEEVENESVRLPIDRVFSVTGFGTVVTGTLHNGIIDTKEPLVIYPHNVDIRIRNIQVHEESKESAYKGQRVALNVVPSKKIQIVRGDIIATKDSLTSSMIINCKFKHLSSSIRPLENWTRIRFYHGTNEILGRIVLLDKEVINPGEDGFVQFRLESVISTKMLDKFIVRLYSPLETLGGGIVLEPNALKAKRFDKKVINSLTNKLSGDNKDIIINHLDTKNFESIDNISSDIGIDKNKVKEIIKELTEENKIIVIDNYILSINSKERIKDNIINILYRYHNEKPFSPGMQKEELKSRLFKEIKQKGYDIFLDILVTENIIKILDSFICNYDFEISISDENSKVISDIYSKYVDNLINTPDKSSYYEVYSQRLVDDIFDYLLYTKKIVKLSEQTYLSKENYEYIINTIINRIKENGKITVSECRDIFDTSRKYVILILEHMDNIKLTKRDENDRVLF